MIVPLYPPFVRPPRAVLHPALAQIQERQGLAGAGPGEGHEGDQSAGDSLGGLMLKSLEKKKLQGDIRSLSMCKRETFYL